MPPSPAAARAVRQAHFTSSSGRCRDRASCHEVRSCAARRELETAIEPSQVSGEFRSAHPRSYPEGYGCYCADQHADGLSGGTTRQKAHPNKGEGAQR